MRPLILAMSLLVATPALAGQPVPPPPLPAPGIPPASILPPELTDPAMADRMGRVAGAVTRSLMNLPVGEIEAAIEGRPVTREDRRRTVRDSVGDPDVEQRIAEQAAASGRTIQVVGQAANQALANSLPAIMQAIEGARVEIERAVANLPNPTYPVR